MVKHARVYLICGLFARPNRHLDNVRCPSVTSVTIVTDCPEKREPMTAYGIKESGGSHQQKRGHLAPPTTTLKNNKYLYFNLIQSEVNLDIDLYGDRPAVLHGGLKTPPADGFNRLLI